MAGEKRAVGLREREKEESKRIEQRAFHKERRKEAFQRTFQRNVEELYSPRTGVRRIYGTRQTKEVELLKDTNKEDELSED